MVSNLSVIFILKFFNVMEKSCLVNELHDFIHLQSGHVDFGKIYWNYPFYLAQGSYW